MYRRLKARAIRRRTSLGEGVILVLVGLLTFLLAKNFGDNGIALKWVTVVVATTITFGLVIYMCRQRLVQWSFWVSLIICLAVHAAVVWAFFQYVLKSVARFGILLWYPVMLVEVVVLLIAIKRIEKTLTGRDEITKLTF